MKSYQKLSLLLILVCILIPVPPKTWALDKDGPEYFKLDPLTDILLLGGGLILNAGTIAVEVMSEPAGNWSFDGDISQVNPFDRSFLFPYSKPLDTASTIVTCGMLLAPALLFAAPKSEWLTLGTMFVEAVIWSWGLKELGKNLVHRNRPYTYCNGFPESEISNEDFQQSFPSGHTALAFTGASFCSFVFGRYFKSSPWKVPLIAASYSLAVGSAVLRVASGSHFLTDVIVGMVIGTLSGFIVPWLHTSKIKRQEEQESWISSLSVALIPPGIQVGLNF